MWYVRYGKRFLDIGLVVLFSPLWLPLFSLVACLVWLFMGRPIFFLQERPGKDGALLIFNVWRCTEMWFL